MKFTPVARRRRLRPDLGPGAWDEIALTDTRRIVARISSRPRLGWGTIGLIPHDQDPHEAFEAHASRWGYTIQPEGESR